MTSPVTQHCALRPALALCLLAGLLDGCDRPKAAQAKPPLAAVEVVELAAPRAGAPIRATGALRRRREMMLSFRIAGVITQLAVEDGDTVRQGQTIATLDSTAVRAKLRQTQADLDQARRDAARSAQLVIHGDASRQFYEAQRTRVLDAQAEVEAAAFDLRWATLVAPASGVVLSRVAQSGEVMTPGQPVVSLADDSSPLVLRVPLADRDVARVHLGQTAGVTLDTLPGETLSGRVSLIGQRADPLSGAVEVEVTLPLHEGLRSGLIARADIAPDAPFAGPAGLARIPAEAMLEADHGTAYVLILNQTGDVAHRLRVGFGGFDGDEALVSGLPPGTRVITSGAGYVADGERVSVIDPARDLARPAQVSQNAPGPKS